jgi:hypothetical protein
MSNYTKATNFATKDNLSSGNPLKIVKGTEINTEFDAISVAIATKADTASPSFTGTPSLPTGTTGVTQTAGTSNTTLATTAFVQTALQAIYPVGSIYTNATNSTNPGTLLGFGTWTAFGAGRVPVGFDSTNALFDAAEETGGSADATLVSHTHTATVSDTGHTHTVLAASGGNNAQSGGGATAWGGGSVTSSTNSALNVSVSNSTEGSSATNANYQPYITVYMWKRTA